MTRPLLSLVAGVLLALAVPAMAQPPGQGPAPGRERIARMIEEHFARRLREDVGLGAEQVERIMPMVRRLQQERRQAREARLRALQELRRVLASGTATEARVAGLVQSLRAQEREAPERVRRGMDEIDAQLTPVQQAKFRILEVALERKVREARERWRRQGAPRDGGRAPGDDDPDP
ncbi:MAG TPA: hypothetical protein VII13_10370 [Vicinamibacteria bacterium]|jgi:hypothetical protein